MVIVIHISNPNLQKRVRFCFRPLKVASTCWRLRFPIPHSSEVGWDASWRSWSRYSPTGWPTLWCLRTSFKMFLLKLETNFNIVFSYFLKLCNFEIANTFVFFPWLVFNSVTARCAQGTFSAPTIKIKNKITPSFRCRSK